MERRTKWNLRGVGLLVGLCLLSLAQYSCAHRRHVALNLDEVTEQALGAALVGLRVGLEALQEMFAEQEWRFIEWMAKQVRADVKKAIGSPGVIRSWGATLTYPSDAFPEGLPDGVWLVQSSDGEVSDPRFLREPVGREDRSDSEGSVKQVGIFARQRSDTAERIVGELFALGETLHDSAGKVEYGLFSVRIVGTYDAESKEWSLVSESVEPVGQP